jgi:hypothetical protein
MRMIGETVCPSPNGEGMELTSFLADGVLGFQVNVWLRMSGLLPLGGDGRGVVCLAIFEIAGI